MFKKILIANRGEIALRVIRSAQEMGIKTVAVFSDADRDSLPVKTADEAYYIGKSPASESYLNIDKIIEAAKRSGADAIHPGYGFLSEKAEFSQRCKDEGIIFIGPEPFAMQTMGDKITARLTMMKAGVPVVPGYEAQNVSNEQLLAEAEKIGYPIMVKASAGGGGKGMRLVHSADDLIHSVEMAKGEAKSSFGDDTVYMERYISSSHHIEFQILADKHGTVLHINERECSVQRRHQKIIEETPSTIMTPEVRAQMGQKAADAARAVNYHGAGTIEFLVDDNLNYYFLEMNTRLQVEHPITELTSDLDLVKEQIRIAAGEKLELRQEDIKQYGHAIECRIYAEDPENNFMPSPGKVYYVKQPSGPGVRVDGYVYSGFKIPMDYDPMISKLIVHGKDRNEAIMRMRRALLEFRLLGLKHNIPYLYNIFKHPKFVEGGYNTRFIELYGNEVMPNMTENQEKLDAAAIAIFYDYYTRAKSNSQMSSANKQNNWRNAGRINF